MVKKVREKVGEQAKGKLLQNDKESSKQVTKSETRLKPGDGKLVVSEQDTMKLSLERDIAMDFAAKVYKKFSEMIKSVVLFGSSSKKVSTPSSDIDVIVIIDDVSIRWDLELVSWYREELGKVIKANPYRKSLHINTVKLSTWWDDLIRGDPVVINVVRYGDPLIDFGGFFSPLKVLLEQGKIKSTPEAVYTLLERAPTHLARTRASILAAIDGLYWAMVDSAHAALIAANVMPPSPEEITIILKEQFVDKGMLKMRYVEDYRDLHLLAKGIVHGEIVKVSGKEIDDWQVKTDEFVGVMAELVGKLIEKK